LGLSAYRCGDFDCLQIIATVTRVYFANSNIKILNSKQYQMTEIKNSKPYDLEERTFQFARRVSVYVNGLPRTVSNVEQGKQLARSSGSVAANYIEANEALSRKDFLMRIKICRKEAKESRLWIRLSSPLPESEGEKDNLLSEALELTKIFGSIVEKSK